MGIKLKSETYNGENKEAGGRTQHKENKLEMDSIFVGHR